MNTLVIYFSRTGNNEKVAKMLQQQLNADLERVDDGRSRCFLRDGMEAATHRKVNIKPLQRAPANYDTIVLVTPVYASNLPAPMRTFMELHKETLAHKNLFLASCSLSGGDDNRIVQKAEQCIGRSFENVLLLKDRDLKKGLAQAKILEFAQVIKA